MSRDLVEMKLVAPVRTVLARPLHRCATSDLAVLLWCHAVVLSVVSWRGGVSGDTE